MTRIRIQFSIITIPLHSAIEITIVGGGENIAPVGIEDAIKHELDQEGYSEIILREPVLNNYSSFKNCFYNTFIYLSERREED